MTMMTATYPLAGLQSEQRSSTAAARPRAWGFWATMGWFGLAAIGFFVAAIACGFGYGLWWGITHPHVPFDANSPVLGLLVTAISMPAAALVLVFAARRAGWSARDYLGLALPKLSHVLIGLGSLVAFGVLISILAYLFPSLQQSAMGNEYRAGMGNLTAMVLFWLTLVGTAPVAEEVIFRGFLFRGLSESRLGAGGALLLTSLIFAVIHLQYTLPGMAVVFGLGLVFGLLRWRSGSTMLSILVHATWNFMIGAGVALSM